MDNKFLMQEEIDALLNGDDSFADLIEKETKPKDNNVKISSEEVDVLGEVGNISMGSAATTLSQLLNQKVLITSPKVKQCTQEELFGYFNIPYLAIEVDFVEGLEGSNILVMKLKDASIIANMMMGGDGLDVKEELSEIELSAATEAMNQMIGSSATSMAQIFNMAINISPPKATIIDYKNKKEVNVVNSNNIITVSFRMTIGDLVDTEIMQIMSTMVAKRQAGLLISGDIKEGDVELIAPIDEEPIHNLVKIEQEFEGVLSGEKEEDDAKDFEDIEEVVLPTNRYKNRKHTIQLDKKYELILDIPLKVSVVLGKSKKPIGEVLRLMPGSIIELDKILNEDVDILVNGTLVAKGEVVVVDENFGVRIKNIISPADRINYIK